MPSGSIHQARKIRLNSILTLIIVVLIVASSCFIILYRTAYNRTKIQLEELVGSQGRLIEAVGKFDAFISSEVTGGHSKAGTLSQVKEANIKYRGFGNTGEFVLFEPLGDEIIFILPTRKNEFKVLQPLRRTALIDQFLDKLYSQRRENPITLERIDYMGDEVLGSFVYLPFMEMVIGAKMDMTEIRQPYYYAALITGFIAFITIIIGTVLNRRLVNPLVNQISRTNILLQERESKLENLSQQLSKYLSPQIYKSIFEGKKTATISHQRKKLTIFFSDIVGFTSRTDQMEPEDVSYLLNSYLNRMSELVIRYGGTLDKFIGDAVLVFFGDPETKGVKEDALAAVEMAIAMQKEVKKLITEWESKGIPSDFSVRIGITTGYCTVGNFGSENRMDYTIIGNQVNLASRLESNADPGTIWISEDTYSLIKTQIECQKKGSIEVKGFIRPINVCQVKTG